MNECGEPSTLTPIHWQDLIDDLLESNLPPSLQELRILGDPRVSTSVSCEMVDAADSAQLEQFAKRHTKLRYMSLSGSTFKWDTYGIIP
jgi:hypothetical protein